MVDNEQLYLWLVERTDNPSWNEYGSMVVIAATEEEALAPNFGEWTITGILHDWVPPKFLKATKVGIALPGSPGRQAKTRTC